MGMDQAITLLQAFVALAVTFVGLEMSDRPPATSKQRWAYRILFFILGGCILGLTLWQSSRNTGALAAAEQRRQQDAVIAEGNFQYVKGKLDALTILISQYVVRPSQSAEAAALARAARDISKAADSPPEREAQLKQQARDRLGQLLAEALPVQQRCADAAEGAKASAPSWLVSFIPDWDQRVQLVLATAADPSYVDRWQGAVLHAQREYTDSLGMRCAQLGVKTEALKVIIKDMQSR